MWRAQLLAASLLAVVAASGRTSGQQTGGSSGGSSSGGGSSANGAAAPAVAPSPEPAPAAAAPPTAAVVGGGGEGSPGLPVGAGTGGAGPPGVSWLQVPGSTGRRDLDVQSLLQLRDAVENWDEFSSANGFQGWNDTSSVPVCSWSGVTCADDGTILTLSWQCRTCPVRAIGKLPPGLGSLSTLATLDLQSNSFYGTLPKQWGEVDNWPQLQNIYLNDNNLTGTLPEEWGQPGAMPSLLQLRVDSNRLTGTLPQNWGIEETSMRELGVIRLSNNSLNGTLPEQWGTPGAFPQLSVLSLDRNNITGTLPEIWGAAQAMTLLQELYLQNNSLTGGLPLQWGGPQGMARMRFFFAANNPLGGTLPPTWGINGSFPEMKTLDLNNTKLTGTLPPEWGNIDAMPALDALRIERNDLSGSIPQVSMQLFLSPLSATPFGNTRTAPHRWPWCAARLESCPVDQLCFPKQDWTGFETLSRLVIKPGNPRLCGPAPQGLGFSLCDDRDLTCLRIPINLSSTCEPVQAAARPPAEEMLAEALRSPPAGGGGGGAAAAAPVLAPAPAGGAPASGEPSGSSSSGSSGGGTNVGAIVGGVVGGVAAVAIAGALLAFVLGRRRREQRRRQELLRQDDLKPSARPFISEEEEMERGMGGAALSPVAAATAVPHREYSTITPHSNQTVGAATRGSSRTVLSETERRSSRLGSLLGISSGRLGSNSASGLLARWCSQSRTDSLELPSSPEEGPVPGVPSGGLHVMAQIAEEEGGSSSQDKQKQSDEDAAIAGALGSVDAPLPSPGSPLGSAAPSPGAGSGSGAGSGGLNRFFSAALPWSDWEIRPEELEIAKRPDGSDWVLGSGGFGKVFKALRHGVQPVAVKIIPVRGDQHETAVAATRMEIAVLRACRDANIVQFQFQVGCCSH
ncbi:hypothetical protein COHA_009097 [Chlorella ohadii]|uniref:Protein kinase domain-containing protein n=1 Tax=Chlorella ohadii TaxID=2649997 RepID=A0AAD5GYC9_9CHLO|nr:hypothetical protein COHA_009097 [Chlorella ohadii]